MAKTRSHTRWALGFVLLLAGAGLIDPLAAQAPAARDAVVAPLKGQLARVKVRGRALEGNLLGDSADPWVSIYLPPSYSRERNRRYPVLYMLHGFTNTDAGYFGVDVPVSRIDGLESRQADVGAERAFSAGTANEMILVMPNCYNTFGGCWYSSSVTTGDWERYVAEHLVAYMDQSYRTLARRESRGLAGHSMGGYGAIRIGMKHPDVFSAIYAMSSCCLNEANVRASDNGPLPAELVKTAREAFDTPGVLATFARAAAWSPNPENPPFYLDLPTKNGEVQAHVVAKWAANTPVSMLPQYVSNLNRLTAIAIDIGLQDNLITGNAMLVESLARFGVAHTYETYEGDHGNRIRERIEKNVLPFFSRHLSFDQSR